MVYIFPMFECTVPSSTRVGRQTSANKQTCACMPGQHTSPHTDTSSGIAVPLFFAQFTGRNRTSCALHRTVDAIHRLFVWWYATICMYFSFSAALQQTSLTSMQSAGQTYRRYIAELSALLQNFFPNTTLSLITLFILSYSCITSHSIMSYLYKLSTCLVYFPFRLSTQ
jgi:hypothetical protein